jgi:coenzyme F420 hydrogenase subunit beta
MNDNLIELMNTVVANDYCIGCGVCASLTGSPLSMKLDDNGKFRPFINGNTIKSVMTNNALSVCPFSDKSRNETEIGKDAFGHFKEINFNEYTGFYIKNYAGYVKEGEFRKRGSSGGMGNWIATQLLNKNLVDGIIHVKSTNNDKKLLFEYQISNTVEELNGGAKSKYYPIELSHVIQQIKENEGRYALIGIPCYIKSVRLLAEQDEVVRNRIKFYVGLVCGHLKSDMFARSIGWQLGVKPNNLNSIDFRKKLNGQSANNYGVEIVGEKDGKVVMLSSPTKELYTTNWGQGLFKYNACEFCDDVLAETADVTVGDAWLPEYSSDSMGTNVITVRNPVIQSIIEESKDRIHLEELSPEKVYESQAGGFRHRREGLAYRLYLKDRNKEWRPKKRVKASKNISSKRKKIYKKRTLLSQESFKAYKIAEKKEDFKAFIKHMDPLIKDYHKVEASSVVKRVLRRVKRGVEQLVK